MFNNKFTTKDPVAEEVLKVLESWDDDEDDDVKRADAELRRMKAKPIEADKKTDPDKEIGKLAKKTPKEVDEEVVTEGSGPKEKQHTPYSSIQQKHKEGSEFSKKLRAKYDQEKKAKAAAKIGMKNEDKWTDIADGPWKKSNRSKSSAASAAANAAGKGLKGAQHKLDVAKPKGKLTAADFKKLRKEESEQLDEISKKLAVGYMRANTKRMASLSNPDSMEKKMKRHDAYDTATKKYHGEKGVKVKATEEVEQIDEISRDLATSYIRKTKPEFSSPEENKKREGGRSLALKKVWGDKKYGLPEPKVKATEEVEIQEKTLTPAESKKKEEIVKSMKKNKKDLKARYGKRWKEVAYATATKSAKRVAEETNLQEEYADMSHAAKELVLHADNHPHLHYSSHTPIMNNLKKKMKNGTYDSGKAKKLWAYHADRAAQSYAKEHGDGRPWHKMFSTSDRKAAASHWEDMHRHELHEAKSPEMDAGCGSEQPFVTNANTTSSPLMKKIKDVAAKAHSRIKNEMLGKAGATSEEVDPSVKSTDMLKGRVKGGKKDDVGPGADGKSTKIKFTPGPK